MLVTFISTIIEGASPTLRNTSNTSHILTYIQSCMCMSEYIAIHNMSNIFSYGNNHACIYQHEYYIIHEVLSHLSTQ